MIRERKEILYFKQDNLSDQLFDEKSLFFDIETTGFSPKHSQIYLIGCACKKGNQLIVQQFFASSIDEEPELIKCFLQVIEEYQTLISFNGVGFDIPFLKAKCDTYHIKESFGNMDYLDIFKSVSSIKFLLKLENYKQKTIEKFLGIMREDPYSGGELINVYYEFQKTQSESSLKTLLLHNYEDVIGMIDLLPVLSYLEIFHGQYAITDIEFEDYRAYDGERKKEICITLKNDFAVPQRVSFHHKGVHFVSKGFRTLLRVPIFSGELHYFFSDYQNYYYLPDEDLAIHKSIATFVDKKYRETAHAYNCYNRKSGDFLPQYEEIMNPVFRKKYKDKVSYFELTNDFCSSDVMLRRYVDHLLQFLFHQA